MAANNNSKKKQGMPMLDYIVLRKKKKESANEIAAAGTLATAAQLQATAAAGGDKEVEFNGKQVFIDAFEKWKKIFKYSRKKAFKFSDLVEFMKKSKVSEIEQKRA